MSNKFTFEDFSMAVMTQTGRTLPKAVLLRMYKAKYPEKKGERAPKRKAQRLWAKCDYQADGVRYKIRTHKNGTKVHEIVDYRTDYKSTITSSFEGERVCPRSMSKHNKGLSMMELQTNQYK